MRGKVAVGTALVVAVALAAFYSLSAMGKENSFLVNVISFFHFFLFFLLFFEKAPSTEAVIGTTEVIRTTSLETLAETTPSVLSTTLPPVSRKIEVDWGKCEQKRASSYPFVSGDGFRCLADYRFDETSEKVLQPAMTEEQKRMVFIFVKTDMFVEWCDTWHKKIEPFVKNKGYVLLTHNGDVSPNKAKALKILSDDFLIRMFSQNVPPTLSHPKLRCLPIGLENLMWKRQYPSLYSVPQKPFEKRTIGAFMAINVGTHPSRRQAIAALQAKSFIRIIQHRVSLNAFLSDLGNSKFVISPRGNGLDCHRTWEAFARGCIVVTLRSDINSELFEGMPVILVDRWQDIKSLEWLEEQGERFVKDGKVQFEKPKLFLDYFVRRFEKI